PFHIMPDFAPLESALLTLNQKRGLILFLQEALCNVGKHALDTTQIEVICSHEAGYHGLRISDNGCGLPVTERQLDLNLDCSHSQAQLSGQGTYQAELIAQQLAGSFQRRANSPQGIICELIWPQRQEGDRI
ncbi:MAG: ATP-binding protein, partial [Cyanobacteria bacterium J06641_5]